MFRLINSIIILLLLLCLNYYNFLAIDNESLKLVIVIFRHGHRTVNGIEELYPNDPYINASYYPIGLGHLTNTGKKLIFNLGKSLRKKYDKFLGDIYYPEIVEAISTDYNRTKMSLELVLTSLFPPKQQNKFDKSINWQPIPYIFYPRDNDKILTGKCTPEYIKVYNKFSQSPKQQGEYKKYEKIFNYISKYSGLNVTNFKDIYNLYFGLTSESEWGFVLPKWLEPIWPETITNLAIKEYFVATATTELRKLLVGYLLSKIINDIKNVISNQNNQRKMYLYSGHENNIAELSIVLGLFNDNHIPNYGSYITMEIHKFDGKYWLQTFYQNYKSDLPKLLKLPACDVFCEFDKFLLLIDEYLPK